MTAAILIAGLLLALANGANDNFKGVATLFGSGTANYRRALAWATVTTFVGSMLAVLLATDLLHRFSGRGIVSDELAADPRYAAAVGLAAGLTVLLATRFGMPISTTHSLVGALIGAGAASASPIGWGKLGSLFFRPLLASPAVALIGTIMLYSFFRAARVGFGVAKESCFCVGFEPIEVVPQLSDVLAAQRVEQLTATLGSPVTCRERYVGRVLWLDCGRAVDTLHFLSAGVVSFARGLNDTPKIAALLLATPWLGPFGVTTLCGLLIAAGGVASARRVAETMSRRITAMNAGQGFAANLVTGMLVVAASRFGLPVSTTHVSCGALFGIGAVTGRARWRLIAGILAAWLTTLPAAALLGWACFHILQFVR